MNTIIFHGSGRKGGNTEYLLNEITSVITTKGFTPLIFNPAKMKISPCIACDRCRETAVCYIKDDMERIYQGIEQGQMFITITPVYFLGIPSQLKAMIDRCQPLWWAKYVLKREKNYASKDRRGLFIIVGGSRRRSGFQCVKTTLNGFYKTIDVKPRGCIFIMEVDEKGQIKNKPHYIKRTLREVKKLLE